MQTTARLNYAIQTRYDGRLAITEKGFPTAYNALVFADSECGVPYRIVRIVESTGAILPQTDWIDPLSR